MLQVNLTFKDKSGRATKPYIAKPVVFKPVKLNSEMSAGCLYFYPVEAAIMRTNEGAGSYSGAAAQCFVFDTSLVSTNPYLFILHLYKVYINAILFKFSAVPYSFPFFHYRIVPYIAY